MVSDHWYVCDERCSQVPISFRNSVLVGMMSQGGSKGPGPASVDDPAVEMALGNTFGQNKGSITPLLDLPWLNSICLDFPQITLISPNLPWFPSIYLDFPQLNLIYMKCETGWVSIWPAQGEHHLPARPLRWEGGKPTSTAHHHPWGQSVHSLKAFLQRATGIFVWAIHRIKDDFLSGFEAGQLHHHHLDQLCAKPRRIW